MPTLKSLVDETTNIKNELVECHTNLKNNLIEKGVDCNNADKMLNLINKIANIELGKKWASGTYLSHEGATTLNLNLDFNPRLVFVNLEYASGSNAKFSRFSIYFKDINETKSTSIVSGSSNTSHDVTLRDNGIDMYVAGYSKPNTFYWYAFE